MTRFREALVLASCTLVLGMTNTALAEGDGNTTEHRELQRSIYETIEGRYAPYPGSGPYVVEGRASTAGPPPSDVDQPRMNEWQRYEQSNTPMEMEPATRPQD